MKLLTHNMLTSNIIKGVTKGFPLLIEVIFVIGSNSALFPHVVTSFRELV